MSFDGGAPKKGMGSGAKVLIILGIVAGVAMLVCCGGMGYFAYRARPQISQAPAEVAAKTSSVLPMEIDREKWEPKMSMEQDIMLMSWTVCMWSAKEGEGGMSVIGIKLPEGATEEEPNVDAQFDQAFSQNPEISTLETLNVDKSEDRTLKVMGKDMPFKYIEGKRSGSDTEWREWSGKLLQGDDLVTIRIQVEAEHYNEQEIIDMIQSAK